MTSLLICVEFRRASGHPCPTVAKNMPPDVKKHLCPNDLLLWVGYTPNSPRPVRNKEIRISQLQRRPDWGVALLTPPAEVLSLDLACLGFTVRVYKSLGFKGLEFRICKGLGFRVCKGLRLWLVGDETKPR